MTREKWEDDFDNRFGLSGLQSKPLDYANLVEDRYEDVKDFIRTLLDEKIRKLTE